MGGGGSKCETCETCEVCPECVECEPIYETQTDYCNAVVLGPLNARNRKELKKLEEEHKTALEALDTQISSLEAQKLALETSKSTQEAEIETLNRWLHCETSTDPAGYQKADNTYEADFKGKPYWENQLAQCNADTQRYNTEKDNCETWLGVCNEYLAPYCVSNDCGAWWSLPPSNFDRNAGLPAGQTRHCTDEAAASAFALENPVLPS